MQQDKLSTKVAVVILVALSFLMLYELVAKLKHYTAQGSSENVVEFEGEVILEGATEEVLDKIMSEEFFTSTAIYPAKQFQDDMQSAEQALKNIDIQEIQQLELR